VSEKTNARMFYNITIHMNSNLVNRNFIMLEVLSRVK